MEPTGQTTDGERHVVTDRVEAKLLRKSMIFIVRQSAAVCTEIAVRRAMHKQTCAFEMLIVVRIVWFRQSSRNLKLIETIRDHLRFLLL
jgi:hypothetical protein